MIFHFGHAPLYYKIRLTKATELRFFGRTRLLHVDASGTAISIEGLRGLTFGNGGQSGSSRTLYFTAGIAGSGSVEDHGLFGSIIPTASN